MPFLASEEPIFLAGPHSAISVEGAKDLLPLLFDLIPQWPVLPPQSGAETGGAEAAAPNHIVVRKERGHWRIASSLMALSDYDLDDGYMAANSLIGALIAAYVAQDDGLVSIHAGAVAIAGGIILLLGDNEAGKSTFATALASRGQRLFSDDRLVLDLTSNPPIGRSLAIAAKLRLPLPPDADADYRAFVAQNSVLTWPEMAVLRPGPAQAAGFGEALPVRALVQLRRDPGTAQPVLTSMRQPDIVKQLLQQVFAPHLSQQGELSACVRLAQSVGIWELHYASAFSAADTAISHFNNGACI